MDGNPSSRLIPQSDPALSAVRANGFIDFHGYLEAADCWLFAGWTEAWPKGATAHASAEFTGGHLAGFGQAAFFHRPDLEGAGIGLLLAVPGGERPAGHLRRLEIRLDDGALVLLPSRDIPPEPPEPLRGRVRDLLARAEPGPGRAAILGRLSRPAYTGEDTSHRLPGFVRIGLDECFHHPPADTLLVGWILDPGASIMALRLRAGPLAIPVEPTLRHERPDVADAFPAHREAAAGCGFIARLSDIVAPGEPLHLEVETTSGAIGHVPVPVSALRGLPAIRRLLALPDLAHTDIDHAFSVLGPALEGFAREHLRAFPAPAPIDIGPPPEAPEISLIVPLYGRIDFLEYQLALLDPREMRSCELIVVLDDPPRLRALRALADSLLARFHIPLRLLAPPRNLGYGPANNLGLALARGRLVCFLNSDVLPGPPGWLRRLAGHLDADPGLGAVGPTLLFEDGSAQHQGMAFEVLAPYAPLSFPTHPGKGRKPLSGGLARHPAITGACLMARTPQIRRAGGFDPGYLIGDFEDSDLCLRLGEAGLARAVDRDLHLHHLERQSQAGAAEPWRMNLTLYNAWRHHRRWGTP